jgi:hypothetical protein
VNSRAIAARLAGDRREVRAQVQAELVALCNGLVLLSVQHRTGGQIRVTDARAVMDHAHTLFVLSLAEAAA